MWVCERNSPRAVLLLTRNQCSIHCESSRVVHGASKQTWSLQTTRDTPKVHKPSINKSEDLFQKISWKHLLIFEVLEDF